MAAMEELTSPRPLPPKNPQPGFCPAAQHSVVVGLWWGTPLLSQYPARCPGWWLWDRKGPRESGAFLALGCLAS